MQDLVEGTVLVGGELTRHAQHPLADDVALHLIAATAEAATLTREGNRFPFAREDRRPPTPPHPLRRSPVRYRRDVRRWSLRTTGRETQLVRAAHPR